MDERTPQPYMAEPWFALLEAAVASDKRKKAGVADRLGVSRAVISLVINGKYPAGTDRIAKKVLAVYDRVSCPHLGDAISKETCRGHALRDAPTNSPRDMRHWRACQGCALKPKE